MIPGCSAPEIASVLKAIAVEERLHRDRMISDISAYNLYRHSPIGYNGPVAPHIWPTLP